MEIFGVGWHKRLACVLAQLYSVFTQLLYSSGENSQTYHLPSLNPRYFICRVKGWPGKFPSPFILGHSKKPSSGAAGRNRIQGPDVTGSSGALERNLGASLLNKGSLSELGLRLPLLLLYTSTKGCEIHHDSKGSVFIRMVSWR